MRASGKASTRSHPADPHVDREELVEGDHGRSNISAAAPPAWLAWLALITVYVVWGSTYLAIRVMVQSVPALLGAGARFLVAGLLSTPGCLGPARRAPPPAYARPASPAGRRPA